MKDGKTPETTSSAYDAMLPLWRKVQTLLDGTEAMRAAGRQYLPQHFRESEGSYSERLARNTLFNMTKLTLGSWVGRPFAQEIEFEDVPAPIEALFSNIDLLGNDVQVFCRDWFSDGLAKAYSHCYVDFPRTNTATTKVRTLEDDRVENVRPRWVHLRPEQVFFISADYDTGVERLREVRIMETITTQDGFAELAEPQIRRVYREPDGTVMVQLYRLENPKKLDVKKWVVKEEYATSLPIIPMVTFYSDRTGFMLGVPPLSDLADLNIEHWQSNSDQRAVLTVARFPILAVSGGLPDKETIIGPNHLLHVPDPAGKFYYVEHSGAAIAAGHVDLQTLEERMANYGAEFLRKRPQVQKTATERTLDTAESTSPLQDVAVRFGHAMTVALQYTAMWLKLGESGGEAELETEFEDESADNTVLTSLRETRKMKDISRVAYLDELQRRGVLCESFDAEEDATLLENEALDLGPAPDLQSPELDDEGNPIQPGQEDTEEQPVGTKKKAPVVSAE
jgi:hypothetical protein